MMMSRVPWAAFAFDDALAKRSALYHACMIWPTPANSSPHKQGQPRHGLTAATWTKQGKRKYPCLTPQGKIRTMSRHLCGLAAAFCRGGYVGA